MFYGNLVNANKRMTQTKDQAMQTAQLFNDLIDLCREWRDTVEKNHIGGWQNYADDYVRVYFASNSDHSAVQVAEIQVAFFRDPKLEFHISAFNSLAAAIAKGRTLLNEEKARRAQRTAEERAAIRQAKKETLLKKLAEIEQEEVA
jgi:hypothetical protein